jgi:hypothetical protein
MDLKDKSEQNLRIRKVNLGFKIMEQERNLKRSRSKLDMIQAEIDRRETIKLHDHFCYQIDQIIENENPCGLNDEGSCIAYRTGKLSNYKSCCRRCRFVSDKGCTSRSLGCKLWFCLIAENNLSDKSKLIMSDIKKKAFEAGFSGIFGEQCV